jgi:flagellar motor switch protein FliM
MTSHTVVDDIIRFFPATMELATAAIIIAALLGIPIGVLAAVKQGSRIDHVIRVITLAGQSLPIFVLALISLLVFYATLEIAPGPGRQNILFDDMVPTITGLLTVDSNLIYSIVDVLLGGRRGTAAMRIEGRPYTTIERALVQRMIEVILADAKLAFEPLTPLTFNLDRLETNPRFAAIARPANAAILVKLRIDMEDRGGRVELLLPYATLEPIRKMLLQQFMGEKFGRDNIWESHLATELWTTQMEVRCVLDEQKINLQRVLDFKVGDTLMLNATADSLVELRAGTIPLTQGRMGRRNHSIAVRVETSLSESTKRAIRKDL